jgi:hypothetical protein
MYASILKTLTFNYTIHAIFNKIETIQNTPIIYDTTLQGIV